MGGTRKSRLLPWLTAGVLACGVTLPMSAQVSYTVFVAHPSEADIPAQPTLKHGSRTLVTLIVQDSTVKYVVNELARQAQLKPLFYSSVALAQRITVHVSNMDVMDALGSVLHGTGLEAKLLSDGETVAIHPQLGSAAADRARLAGGIMSGRVTDSASGAGLGGASVKVEGTKLSTVTSDSGHFTLKDVPIGDQVLSVKLFGYRPAERTVTVVDSERTTVHIVMVPVPTVLSGVVTTAVGEQARYQVGNDITVLNADSIQKVAPVTTLTQMLETRVPGLVVQHTNGIPGAPSRLRLRGLSSVNMSADPILIVDGIRIYTDQSGSNQNGATVVGVGTTGGGSSVGTITPGNNGRGFAGPSALDQIDPASIETIEVLKGPSATAIYGSDAANGVIVVTTKHGRPGPTHWTLTLDQGRTTLPGEWPMHYFTFGHSPVWSNPTSGLCEELQYDHYTNPCVLDSLVAFQALDNPTYSPLTGQPGQNRDASLTVTGGNGTLTYSVTGSASGQSGYLHLPAIELTRFQLFHGFAAPGWMRTPDQYGTYGASSQLNVQLGPRGGTLSLTSSLFRSTQQQSSLQSDLAALANLYVDTTQLASNPLFPDYYTRALLNTTTFTNAVNLSNWAPWGWLPLTATAGLNVQNLDNNELLPRDYFVCDPGNCTNGNPSDTAGSFSVTQGTNTSGTLTVGTVLTRQRVVSTAVGLNVYTLAQSGYSAQTTGLPVGVSVPTSFVYAAGNGPSYSTVSQATYGWYVQPTLNLNSRFFASPGFRLDGGSNSGTQGGVSNGALSLFPKLDLSWVAVERSPSQPLFGALTLLRPRIAFGIAGIQPGPGEQLRLLQPAQVAPLTSSGAGTPTDVLSISTLGNPQLHPERDRELEGGVDAQFWNQRLTLTLTGYQKMAYDAILAIPVAASVLPTGAPSTTNVNIGTIRNTGVEATVFARILDTRAIDWSVNANLSKNNNLLVSLAPGVLPVIEDLSGRSGGSAVTSRLVPGYPLFGLWAPPILGFSDANHDGLIESNEVRVGDSAMYIGAQQPNYEVTLSTTLAFFNDRLTINTSIDYQAGLTQYAPTDCQTQVLGCLDARNESGAQQAAYAAATGNNTDVGLLQTVNTLRWNTLSISYLVPAPVAHLLHVPTVSVALQGSNLGLFSHYRGVDPNVNAYSSGNLTEDTGGLLPQPRVWNVHVSLGY
jgi:TonB-dependent SusC/RagA subfamily outer membrane receptor